VVRALPREPFEIKMSLRKRKDRQTLLDTIEDWAFGPSGGRTKQWLAGVVVAAVPIVYGIVCIQSGSTTLFGSRASAKFTSEAGFRLAVAYVAAGAFLHFHYFWGLSERLWPFSQITKILSLLVFLPSLFYALYRHVA
jgi:hypothetical protein